MKTSVVPHHPEIGSGLTVLSYAPDDGAPISYKSIKISLKYITKSKRRKIQTIIKSYCSAVNHYIKKNWEVTGNLDKETYSTLKKTRLTGRYRANALRQALNIINSTKKMIFITGNKANTPKFAGNPILDKKFITIEDGQKSFDLIIKLSTLSKGNRIILPARKTKQLNYWLSKPGAELLQGCILSEDYIYLNIAVPIQPVALCVSEKEVIGLDIGKNKLISDSNGNHFGTDFNKICTKINRRRSGSRGRQRAYEERKNYIGRIINNLPWNEIRVVGIEALYDMKRRKQKGRNRAFRKAVAPWTYRQVLTRIGFKASENRVRLIKVNPANTSRTCPACGWCSKYNRMGEDFECTNCHHKADADTVGAVNVLARTILLRVV